LLPLLAFLSAASGCGGGEDNPFNLKSELVTTANRPIAMAFAPDGRLFYAEQFSGNIRVVTPEGDLLPEPFAHVDVAVYIDWGLTGLALDPDFQTNHYVYVYFTKVVTQEPSITATPSVMRFTEQDNRGISPKVIIDDFPETNPERPGIGANGNIHFGPDRFLYITLGDYDRGNTLDENNKAYAQDLKTPLGKMLRIDPKTGTAPLDNPFVKQTDADPRVFAYGFYKPFPFAFHPKTRQIFGVDNTASCEELNIIKSGGNYGWPDVGDFPWPDCNAGTQIKGIHFFALDGKKPGDFLSVVGVNGMDFASGDVYPALGDSLLTCESVSGKMRRVVLSGSTFDQVSQDDSTVVEDCKLSIAVSPNGTIYYSNETEIRRLTQQKT